jgi:prephenate dehydrogenase
MTSVLVLGTGLIGTSLGLALLHASPGPDGPHDVLLDDVSPDNLQAALERGAGRPWDRKEQVDLLVAAGPPRAIPGQLRETQRLGLASTYTHVSSVQSQVQREVEALSCDLSSIVGGHPLAGRETSGPTGAQADLFLGRPWALCPSPVSTPQALAAVRALAEAVGAVPVELSADEHDHAVAVLSHLPQVVASALAGQLVADGRASGPLRTELSGPGLADTTRLAASGPGLWTQILAANSAFVSPAVRALAADLEALAAALDAVAHDGAPARAEATDEPSRAIAGFLERGNRGRALVPVKRGVRDVGFARVAVTVDDRPGRLAALLTAAGQAQVNVEDVHVDHVPGRPTGVIELLVAVDARTGLETALRAEGWLVREEQEAL